MMRFDTAAAAAYLGLDETDIKTAVKHRQVAYVRPTPRKIFLLQADLDAWRDSWRRYEPVKKNGN